MFGSQVLETAIGLIFIFTLLSLVCSALSELIESFLKKRASDLERGLRALLADSQGRGLVRDFYRHPLIRALYRDDYQPDNIHNGSYRGSGGLPSYIPARTFALTLLDLVAPAGQDKPSGTAGSTNQPAVKPVQPLREALSRFDNPMVRRALLALVDAAGNDMAQVRANIEAWYDDSMERVSGWYRRRVQKLIFVLGLLLAVALNADTIAMGIKLYQQDVLRGMFVAAAEQQVSVGELPTMDATQAQEAVLMLAESGLPLGWSNTEDPFLYPVNAVGWGIKILGWLMTALAISLGAPFWYEVLQKAVALRTSLRPPQSQA